MDLAKIYDASFGSALAREITRVEDGRAALRKALVDKDLVGKQMRELAQSSGYSRLHSEIKTMLSPSKTLSQQYKTIFRAESALGSAFKSWQESERVQRELMRQMRDPMADIRKSVLEGGTARRLKRELATASSTSNQMKELSEHVSGIGSVARMLAQQSEESRTQRKKLLEELGAASSIRSYLRDFEQVNKRWKVPGEVLSMMGSVKELQQQLGLSKVALPTIDWGSAAALAQAMGREGIQEQLSLLGIEPDGSIHQLADEPEKGLLSKRQSDVFTLISLLLTVVFFFYQDHASSLQQAKTEIYRAQSLALAQLQVQQLQALTSLIERTLVETSQEPAERLVVRGRITTVRLRPQHGAPVDGQLLPNEVVRAVGKKGKWVEVEYYSWLYEEYRRGWVLKKYLERVPANFEKSSQY
ncbi:SH3 domain-containing protein [Delftia acidovorans]|uniref:SH3 domain-containing protein n=1 Tax=Delftia acidovorans TaxID=80866 RepID=UPI0032DF8667